VLRDDKVAVATNVVQGGEGFLATSDEDFDPALERVWMELQDGADARHILAAIQQEDRMQTFRNAPVVGLLETSLRGVPLASGQRELLLAHRVDPFLTGVASA